MYDIFPDPVASGFDVIIPERTITVVTEYATEISEFRTGAERRYRKWLFPRRKIQLRYIHLLPQKQQEIIKAFQESYGSWGEFWYHFPHKKWWYKEFIAYTDGSTTTFNLPCLGCSKTDLKVYIGSPTNYEELRVNWDFGFISGNNIIPDRIVFQSPLAGGQILFCDFYGRLRIKVRFAEDNLTETWEASLSTVPVNLVEVKRCYDWIS